MSTRKGQVRKTARKAYFPKRRPSPRIAQLERSLKTARSRNKILRAGHTNPKAPQALGMGAYGGAAVVAGGGAIAGVVGELFPSILGIDTRLVAGAALTVAGAMSKAEHAQIGACLGAGMLACYAEDLAGGLVSGEGFNLLGSTDEEAA
tara:strand:- start:2740 stop:3186 length:447 start_codon:yes stop_codon:yes gene_type:complete